MKTKKILGLDLGVGSVGWAVIQTEESRAGQILGMGSRIVPLDEGDDFRKGKEITTNASRTAKRTARKGYDRYQIRRTMLTQVLSENGMLPSAMNLPVIELWQLRADAATPGHKLTLPQIGRVLYHLNQKRGYKHAKEDSSDSKQTKYVEDVNQRYAELQSCNKTIGQYMLDQLKASQVEGEHGVFYTFRIKDRVYPRAAYVDEYDKIMDTQQPFYPDILTDELIAEIRNHIIFYQRPLKSCKHLVSQCEFEKRSYARTDGSTTMAGPKVAPQTAPLSQLCSIWEAVNNISLKDKYNEDLPISLEQRKTMVAHLWTHPALKHADVCKIVGVPKKEYSSNKTLESTRGLTGNKIYCQIRDALGVKDNSPLLQFDIKTTSWIDTKTGAEYAIVSDEIEKEPLQQLWHTLYSTDDKEVLRQLLAKKFGITSNEVADKLFSINLKTGYANKSTRFMRKLLPLLMTGYGYSEACEQLAVNHSNSLTAEEEANRPLKNHLSQLQKNELRQPVVEKILNQMVNVVNALADKYGQFDEIHIELARDLKSSREERKNAIKTINDNTRLNEKNAEKIREYGLTANRSRLQKYRLWEEAQYTCFYCGKQVDVKEFLLGTDVEVEHIVPRAVLFDDSYANKVCSCRKCNAEKGNMTAIEYMETKPKGEFEAYIQRAEDAFKSHRISQAKYDRLHWHVNDIPEDFIERQLRQSQYISRKAQEMLRGICHEVIATSGQLTDHLRQQWGYDKILETLNYPTYSSVGLVRLDEKGKERIKDWSKRLDQRHHAVDALTIALTNRSIIKRLNTLHASEEEMKKEVAEKGEKFREKTSLMNKWLRVQPHFLVRVAQDFIDGILVSYRAKNRATTPGKRFIYTHQQKTLKQRGLRVPRGPLSDETVYGKIGDTFVVRYPLNHPSMKPDKIVDPTIRKIVEDRLNAYGGNAKEAFADPLYSDAQQTMQIRAVRCYVPLKEMSMMVVSRNAEGEPIGFAKMGSNHSVCIYQDKKGGFHEMVTPFALAVEREVNGLPAIITDPHDTWTSVMNRDDISDSLLKTLPNDDWTFCLSLQQNDMFILGLTDSEYEDALAEHNYKLLNKHLYRVQKLSSNDYYFRYHLETSVDDKYEGEKNAQLSRDMRKLILTKSLGAFFSYHPHKVHINVLGEIRS